MLISNLQFDLIEVIAYWFPAIIAIWGSFLFFYFGIKNIVAYNRRSSWILLSAVLLCIGLLILSQHSVQRKNDLVLFLLSSYFISIPVFVLSAIYRFILTVFRSKE